ncbi:hypothetical protein Tco_0695543 [Tanacetum coccineum]
MAESTKRHEENSNIIKEIRASTAAAKEIKEASIKTLKFKWSTKQSLTRKRNRRTYFDSKTEIVGEAINESFDPIYGNYIELNDLDMPLEPRMNQDDFEPTLDFINEPTYKSCYKINFSCMIEYRHVNVDFLPSLSINIMTKHFYNSIIKDKGDHEGKNLARTLIDIPIFVRKFSIISGFSITNDVDITSGVVLDMPFCKKFVSCQKIMERFAHGDECERIDE